mgnify:CR=1 FL=1
MYTMLIIHTTLYLTNQVKYILRTCTTYINYEASMLMRYLRITYRQTF